MSRLPLDGPEAALLADLIRRVTSPGTTPEPVDMWWRMNTHTGPVLLADVARELAVVLALHPTAEDLDREPPEIAEQQSLI